MVAAARDVALGHRTRSPAVATKVRPAEAASDLDTSDGKAMRFAFRCTVLLRETLSYAEHVRQAAFADVWTAVLFSEAP